MKNKIINLLFKSNKRNLPKIEQIIYFFIVFMKIIKYKKFKCSFYFQKIWVYQYLYE